MNKERKKERKTRKKEIQRKKELANEISKIDRNINCPWSILDTSYSKTDEATSQSNKK